MENKREKIISWGIVPIAAALIGGIATVVVGRMFNSSDPTDAIKAVVSDSTINAVAKAKLLQLINGNDQQFYDFLKYIVSMSMMAFGLLLGAGWFRRR